MADLPSPYSVTPRKPLSNKQRLELFLAHKGMCCICGLKIRVGERWWDEHELALFLGSQSKEDQERLNSLLNRGPAHEKCARLKSAKEATDRAHGRRAAEFHFGAKRPKKIMPGSRRHHLKKKLDGSVVHRWKPEDEE